MKVFKVRYKLTDYSVRNVIILSKSKNELPQMLVAKCEDFIGDTTPIVYVRELPLSQVKVSDLSVTELLALFQIRTTSTETDETVPFLD